MIMKGQKRKLPLEESEVWDRSGASGESQRQLVFYISLSKYQRGQELPEPSLRRSVLVANTLRLIGLEAGKAPSGNMGVSSSPCDAASTLQTREREGERMAAPNCHSAGMVANSHLAVANLPSAASHHQAVASSCVSSRSPADCLSVASPSCMEDDNEDWGSMSADPDFSLSAAISSILTALDTTMDGSPQATQRTPLRSLENLAGPAGVPEGDTAGAKQGVKGHWGAWERQEECRAVESSVEVMRSSYLGDVAVDDLFQDIDTSLLERDMGALGVRGGGGDDLLRYLPPFSSSSSFSPHPFSLSLNHNLKCLPSFSSFSPSSSSSSSPSHSSPSHYTREGFELEHLMEILVES